MARNLRRCCRSRVEYGPARIAFCTDDRDPEDIADNGHINGMVREAVASGIAPEDALVMASFNPAQWHGLRHLGAVAPGLPGRPAAAARPRGLRARRSCSSAAARSRTCRRRRCPSGCARRCACSPSRAADFAIPSDGAHDPRDRADRGSGRDRVARARAGRRRRPRRRGRGRGPRQDRRRRAAPRDRPDRARLRLRLRPERGALASSVAHDAHNLVVVGMSDEDMAFAVEPPRRDRRRHRRRRRRPGRRGVPAARRRAALRRAARRR